MAWLGNQQITLENTTATFVGSGTYDGRQCVLRLKLIESDFVKGLSTFEWTFSTEGGKQEYYDMPNIGFYEDTKKNEGDPAITKIISGTSASSKVFPAAKGSVSGTVKRYHNADGWVTFSFIIYSGVGTTGVASDTAVVQFFQPRKIELTTAPNFNDEDNPIIEYNNYAKEQATSVTLSILSDDSKTTFATRDVSLTATSYTFMFTDAERKAMRQACNTKDYMSIKIKASMVIGYDTLTAEATKTYRVINAEPTMTAFVARVDDGSGSLTGDDDTLVMGYSAVQYSFVPVAAKEATIVATQVVCGSQNSTETSGIFYDIDSCTFSFYAKDSRGKVTRLTIDKPIINYVKPTCNLEMNSPNTDGELTFNIVGKYWDGDVGAIKNSLTVQYRYCVNEGEYGDWITVQPTLGDDNTYSVEVYVSGLNYTDMYRFNARAIDKIITAESGYVPTKTRPVFDWGEFDFNFNCPVTITDGYLKYPLMGVINSMTKTYNCNVSVTAGENYLSASGSATICGNILRCNIVASRSSNFTGDGANEVVASISIDHGGKIAGMLNVSFPNGSNGAVASLYTSNVSQTYETLDFNVYIAAAAGSTTKINSFFQVPIIINLDKFVEE